MLPGDLGDATLYRAKEFQLIEYAEIAIFRANSFFKSSNDFAILVFKNIDPNQWFERNRFHGSLIYSSYKKFHGYFGYDMEFSD